MDTKIKLECLFYINEFLAQREPTFLRTLDLVVNAPVGPPLRFNIWANSQDFFRDVEAPNVGLVLYACLGRNLRSHVYDRWRQSQN